MDCRTKVQGKAFQMKPVNKKLILLLILVLLVNMLLPNMSALAAEKNNFVIPSKMSNAGKEYILSPGFPGFYSNIM